MTYEYVDARHAIDDRVASTWRSAVRYVLYVELRRVLILLSSFILPSRYPPLPLSSSPSILPSLPPYLLPYGAFLRVTSLLTRSTLHAVCENTLSMKAFAPLDHFSLYRYCVSIPARPNLEAKSGSDLVGQST